MLVSALASFVSSYVWGRLADWSSRRVLMLTGLLGAAAMLAAAYTEPRAVLCGTMPRMVRQRIFAGALGHRIWGASFGHSWTTC